MQYVCTALQLINKNNINGFISIIISSLCSVHELNFPWS